jgi:3-oxoacyl-[acyl-carrier-protein] synthase III
MGVIIDQMNSHFYYGEALEEKPRQVLDLALQCVDGLSRKSSIGTLSHIVIATTCPDKLAPSLGQMLVERYHSTFSDSHVIDIVQGCAGGVTALILASQLASMNKSNVLVIQADAAAKATSSKKSIHKIFGNGAFACVVRHCEESLGLLHYKSRQYKDLSEVVTVNLGHDADAIVFRERNHLLTDPRKYLGLSLNNRLALKLMRQAEKFYLDFVAESTTPDVMILHQVNPIIIQHLKTVFSKYEIEFVDVAALTGNCGAASVGIALDLAKKNIANKKVLLCSFGTGGVITAGLWQN